MTLGTTVLIAALAILLVWAAVLWAYRDTLRRLWREPMLRDPVVIIESDDWGPGPADHVEALTAITDTLKGFQDSAGRHPVMTIGLILGIPDAAALREHGLDRYRRITLDDPRYLSILETLNRGAQQGVLSLQLHGLEHLSPTSFMKMAEDPQGEVRQWLAEGDGSDTETLPSHLQSRWIDSATLPSGAIAPEAIQSAVREEMETYTRIFGAPPEVVVPPTFIWNAEVERAWAEHGARIVVTPGRRYTGRNASGQPAGIDRTMRNGEQGEGGATYVVRDIYFEPSYGHRAEPTIEAIRKHQQLGRPALLETHRFNFIGDAEKREQALHETRSLLAAVLREFPSVRFIDTATLGRALRERDPSLVLTNTSARLHIWLRRLASNNRLRKLAWLTGLALPASLLYRLSQ